jgi:GNAT superfamily N-acetyltransferase
LLRYPEGQRYIEERMSLNIYEHDPCELDEVLPFRNAIFGQIDVPHWEAMNCTAVVAREGDKLVGFIPLQFRQQILRPGVTIPVAYENAVGVGEGMRGRGVGTQMIEAAAAFMADRVDALMVIRNGERSDGYRFYRRTGHGDLCYQRFYVLLPETAWPPAQDAGISILERDEWIALEPELLDLHDRRYGRYGGGQQRAAGYWRMIVEGHVYAELPWRFLVLRGDTGRLAGYLVASYGVWGGSPHFSIYEVVGEDDGAVVRLLRYARSLSADGQMRAPYVSLANPVRPLLRELGLQEAESAPHIMARILRPDRIFQRLAAGSNLLRSLSLTVSTPHRTLTVNDPPAPAYRVQLETKEYLLSRMFCCRLDLEAAVRMELVRWSNRDPALQRELYQVFAFSDWVQWFTDYV